MNSVTLIITAMLFMALAYRYYGAFLAAKVLALDDRTHHARPHDGRTGRTTTPTNSGCCSATTSRPSPGPGPLIGPVLAAQFGYAPGFFWMLLGAVHRRRRARHHDPGRVDPAQGQVAGRDRPGEVSPLAGAVGSVAILIIIIVALAGLGVAVVNALRESSWGTFTIAHDDPGRAVRGPLDVPHPEGPHRRGQRHRRDRRLRRARSSAACCRVAALEPYVHADPRAASSSRSPPTASSPRCCRCGCCSARATTCRPT